MSQENFWILLSKKLSGEATPAEMQELEKLTEEHPEWQFAIQNLEDIWNQQPVLDNLLSEDAYLVHLQRAEERSVDINNPGSDVPAVELRSRRKKWYWAAAAAAVMTAAGIFFFKGTSRSHIGNEQLARQVNEISTRQGSRSKIELPDGTVVWLNAGSRLTYNKEYGQQTREVMLQGEGYFDVVKMKERPFIIHTANINIKVLGTVFNVKAYPEDKQTETSLIRGSIEVTIKNRPNDKIILSPSEKLVVENEPLVLAPERGLPDRILPAIATQKLKYIDADSAVAETEWIHDRFVFQDESFGDLAVRMERWYNVQVEITDPELKEKRLTGNFEKETILQALEALKISLPFSYEIKGAKIIINR